jgi:hypothetical protein
MQSKLSCKHLLGKFLCSAWSPCILGNSQNFFLHGIAAAKVLYCAQHRLFARNVKNEIWVMDYGW